MTDSQSLPHVAPAPERLRACLTALAGGMALLLAAMPAGEAARPLAQRVTITRDTRGVPHVVADDEDAAAYGFGYAMAEDHAIEMGRKYLAARGESARVFGDEFAERDLAVTRLRNREAAREALRVVSREFRAWLTAFAAGANAYITAHRDRLPAWVPTVEPGDPLALGRMGTITGALTPPPALLAKYPATSAGGHSGRASRAALDALADDEGDTVGSNAFAVAGSHTSVGVPLLLGNPHLRWAERYWEAHVRVPGRLDFYGSTLAGIPVLRAGFNADVAYVQTNNAPDNEDIYALTLEPDRPDHYRLAGRSYPIVRRQVTIEVKQPDGTMTTRSQAVADTHLGPVVHEAAGRVFAVRALALEAWRHYEGFFHLWRVRSRAQFERVLDRQWMFMSNFTYADTAGHVLYRWNAMLPRRADETADYSLDVDASDPRRLWTGLHRPADLPRLLDPPGGYIQNANNAPWWTSLRDRLDPGRYPAHLERDPPSLRAQGILRQLEARTRWSPADMIAAKYDTRVVLAGRVLPDLLAEAERHAEATIPGPLRTAIDTLAAWDGRTDAGSRGAVLFQRFWERHRAGREQPYAHPWSAAAPIDTPSGLADPAAALADLAAAAADVVAEHGDVAVAWGTVHRFRVGAIDLPADGAPGTPFGLYRVVGFDRRSNGTRIAGHDGGAGDLGRSPMAGTGDAWVMLVQLSRPIQAWSVVAYGQSSDLASPHSADQIRAFAEHALQPVWFAAADIAAHTERTYCPHE